MCALAAVTAVLGFALRDLRLDHDFEKFFPSDDPELDRYNAFRARFGQDNDFLLLGIANAPSVFDATFLTAVDDLAQQLEDLPDVRSVTTPTRLVDPHVTPVGVFTIPWLRQGSDSTLVADSARIWNDPRIKEGFFAADGKALLVILLTEPGLSKQRSDRLMAAVQGAVTGSGLPGIRMGGRIHGQYWYIKKMQRELVLFFSISVVLLMLFLAIGFRTVWGVLVPVGVVGLSVVWQVGLMTLLGEPLGILTMLLPTILFVVGMSDVVHVLQRYIEGLRAGHAKVRAIAIAYYEVGRATFLTSLTTAIGFATLLNSSIGPIREFGGFTAIGVFLALGLAFTLLPAVLLLVGTPIQAEQDERKATWYPLLHRLFRWVLRRRRVLPWGFLALGLVSILFISQLKVDNYLLEDWPDDDPQKQDYFWFEDHFGGVRPFDVEVTVAAPGRSVWDLAVLHEIDTVDQWLRSIYGVNALMSPAEVVRSMNKAMNGGSAEFHELPATDAEVRSLVRMARIALGREIMHGLVDSTARFARITGRIKDEGGHAHKSKNRDLDAFAAAHARIARFNQTGMAYLIDRNNERLSGQLIGGLSIAFLLIAGIMALVFRDLRMVLIALIPNVLPLLFVGAIMALAGIAIKVSTAIIFTIAFGIAVDDTIHMLGKLRIELRKGKSMRYAMKRAFLSTGKALIVTSIMLCSGFVALVFSGFASVFYLGLLVGSTLALALIADLLLLPVLVLMFLRER